MVTHNRQPQPADPLLAELAGLYGVQTAYRDYRGRWRESPAESIAMVLRALGAELGDIDTRDDPLRGVTPARLEVAIRERKRELWSRVLEPVIVAWEGKLPPITSRLPAAGSSLDGPSPGPGRAGLAAGPAARGARFTLDLEDGDCFTWDIPWDRCEVVDQDSVVDSRFVAYRLPSLFSRGERVAYGYHRLTLEIAESVVSSTLISAPRRCWHPDELAVIPGIKHDQGVLGTPLAGFRSGWTKGAGVAAALSQGAASRAGRPWGAFAPLYALRTERDWGAGDLADLRKLGQWVVEQGGSVVATLPLLACYLDQPFDPTPYRPVSRLFWNEFYLAVDQVPEWDLCLDSGQLWESDHLRNRLTRLRAAPTVDYLGVVALKRQLLELLSGHFFRQAHSDRMSTFAEYLETHPHAEEYAAFRASVELVSEEHVHRPDDGLAQWPKKQLPAGRREVEQYHLYCQWQMEEQLGRLSGEGVAASGVTSWAKGTAPGLLLDLPLGVHPLGFDTWRWPELFVPGVSAGAPPDGFFARGQDWSLPPLHPERIRDHGHKYHVWCLRHQMRHARYLRLDHIMSLHCLYWVPEGVEPTCGVYVDYPAEEMYAALCIESNRHQTSVAGEDLGTVPAGVRPAMLRHGVLGSWVLQTSLRPRSQRPVDDVPIHTVASLNTHDMFPFAGFCRGDDIDVRVRMGQLDPKLAQREMAERHMLMKRLAAFLSSVSDQSGAERSPRTPGLPPELRLDGSRMQDIDPAELLGLCLRNLLNSKADLVLVSLEDLLLETQPQNLPGTGTEWGNWRRRAAVSLEDLMTNRADSCDAENPVGEQPGRPPSK